MVRRSSSPSAFQALGTAYQAAGRETEAIAAYEHALKLRPSANSYANLGMLYYSRRDFEAARAANEKAVELQPRNPIARRNLGDTLLRLSRPREARVQYERAIVLTQEQLAVNPSDLELLSLQTLCHAKLGHKDEAGRLSAQLLDKERLPPTARYRTGVALVLIGSPTGVAQVIAAITDGYSRVVAAADDDLASVRDDAALKAVLAR